MKDRGTSGGEVQPANAMAALKGAMALGFLEDKSNVDSDSPATKTESLNNLFRDKVLRHGTKTLMLARGDKGPPRTEALVFGDDLERTASYLGLAKLRQKEHR